MSTDYVLRRPLAVSTITGRTGWRTWENENGHGLTDGASFVYTDEDDKGRIIGYTRFGGNDASGLGPLGAVSEHDYNDPDYAKLFR
jgi:hypothetical protein